MLAAFRPTRRGRCVTVPLAVCAARPNVRSGVLGLTPARPAAGAILECARLVVAFFLCLSFASAGEQWGRRKRKEGKESGDKSRALQRWAHGARTVRTEALIGCFVALAWALGPAPTIASDTPAASTGVEAGRQALSGHARFPWYDAEKDALRRVDVAPPQDTAQHRRSQWQANPAPPKGPSFGTDWSGLRAVVESLLWLGLLAVLGTLIYFLVRTYLHSHAAPDVADAAERETKTEADLIESLPFDVPRPQSDLLAEAQRLYDQGAYAQAIVYLFSYQLVQLDRHQAIRLRRGKTNRQYLRELLSRPDLGGILERTMVAFEDVFFGHHPLDRAGFERCWQRLDEFHQRLTEAAA